MVTMTQIRKGGRLGLGLGSALLVAMPLIVIDESFLRVLTLAFVWGGLAVSWNVFSGYTGYLSLGHTLFFGIGAFTSTLLLAIYEVPPWIGLVAGAILAAVIGAIVGLILLRLSDIYFALATLSIPLALIPTFIWLGYINVPIPFRPEEAFLYMSFRGIIPYYYLGLAMLAFSTAVAWKIKHSRIGFYLNAIKGSEEAAESLGIDTTRYEVYALSLSAFLAALFGTLYVQTTFVLTPEQVFGVGAVTYSVILPVAGGVGTVFGPVIAGLTIYPLGELLRTTTGEIAPGINNIIFGIILIAIMIYLPDGIYTSVRNWVIQRAEDPETETKRSPPNTTNQPEDD